MRKGDEKTLPCPHCGEPYHHAGRDGELPEPGREVEGWVTCDWCGEAFRVTLAWEIVARSWTGRDDDEAEL